jgi:hypothetical protein
MPRRRLSVVLAIGVLVAMTACTPSPAPHATPADLTPPEPTVGIAPQVTLQCAQGNAETSPIAPDLLITDTVGTHFARHPLSRIPRAVDVGVPAPSSADWRFNKSPLLLTDAATSVTISVPDDGRQLLLWVPSAVWGGAGQLAWISHEVTATGCDRGGVSFFGGILATDPTRCFPLTIESASHPPENLTVRVDGHPCSS